MKGQTHSDRSLIGSICNSLSTAHAITHLLVFSFIRPANLFAILWYIPRSQNSVYIHILKVSHTPKRGAFGSHPAQRELRFHLFVSLISLSLSSSPLFSRILPSTFASRLSYFPFPITYAIPYIHPLFHFSCPRCSSTFRLYRRDELQQVLHTTNSCWLMHLYTYKYICENIYLHLYSYRWYLLFLGDTTLQSFQNASSDILFYTLSAITLLYSFLSHLLFFFLLSSFAFVTIQQCKYIIVVIFILTILQMLVD